jgi:hypothetical protein
VDQLVGTQNNVIYGVKADEPQEYSSEQSLDNSLNSDSFIKQRSHSDPLDDQPFGGLTDFIPVPPSGFFDQPRAYEPFAQPG